MVGTSSGKNYVIITSLLCNTDVFLNYVIMIMKRMRHVKGLPANMSRNFFNILEGFQKVEESLDGPEGQYVEDC